MYFYQVLNQKLKGNTPMKKNKLFVAVAAMLLAVAMMLCSTGCAGMEELMELYGAAEIEQLEEGQSIYELSIFDDLPEENAAIDPLFWVAEGENGNKVYFLGSIHVADESAYRIPEYIMNAFLQSDSLAVECDVLALETDIMAQYALIGYYMYTDGSTIQDHIDPELYEAMVEYFEAYPSDTLTSLGYTVDVLNQCKPNMWSSAFDMVSLELSGLDSALGIDSHFLNIAHSMGKPIIELESVEFQYQMLDNFPDELDEILLWSTVTSAPEESALATYELFNAWKRGDASAIAGDDTASEESYSIDTSLFTAEELDWYNAVMGEYVPKLSEYYTDAQLSELKAEGYTEEYLALFLYYYRTDIYTFNELIAEYNDAMITERNKGMANLAEEMISTGQNVFYIVGAGHMVDYSYSDGIITQLRKMGYTVTQIGGIGKDETYDLSYLFEDGVVPTTTVTSQYGATLTTTTASSDVSASDTDNGEEEYDYDLYKEMYEYFGGTTRPEESTTTTTTTASSENGTTTTTTRAGNDGWGWSGSSSN